VKASLKRPLAATEWLAALALSAIVLTYGSKGPQFYLTWATGCVVAAVALLLILVNGQLRQSSFNACALCLAWVVYALAMTRFATDVSRHLQTIVLHAFYVVVLAALLGMCMSSFRTLVRSVGICTLLWVAFNSILLLAYLLGLVSYERDFSGVYYNRNTLAVSGSVLLSFWILLEKNFRAEYGRSVVALSIALLVAIVLSTLSTKGLLAVALLLGLKVVASKGARSFIAPAIIAVSVVAVLAVAGGAVISRTQQKLAALTMVDREAELVGNSGAERVALLIASARVISSHPWTGVGVDNGRYHLFTPGFFVRYSRGKVDDVTEGKYSHNNYAEMLLNAGVPAFVLYYAPIVWLMLRCRKKRNVDGQRDDLRRFVYGALALKLLMDVGMVSYNDLSHILLLVCSCLIYFRFLRLPTCVSSKRISARSIDVKAHAS